MLTVLAPPGGLEPGGLLVLTEGERHHLEVRRAKEGETVRVTDGAGLLAHGTIGSGGLLEVGEITRIPRPADTTLAVGAGDKERFSWLAEKCAELGVTRLVPIECARSANVADRLRPQQLPRLRKRALHAIKQSGSVWAPQVSDPVPLERWLSDEHPGVRWLADHDGLSPEAVADEEPVSVLIGPEGGFTESEIGLILDSGYDAVRLGQLTLRFETAAIAAAVLARRELG